MIEILSTEGIYSGRPPEEIAASSIGEAAAWLDLPKATVRAWVLGQKQGDKQFFEPVIEIADTRKRLLSFRNLVELHVLSALRRKHDISLQSVRKAVEFIRGRLRVRSPLADKQMFTLGADLLVEHVGLILSASHGGQLLSRDIVQAYLDRVDRATDGHPIRLYPVSRPDVLDSPRSVVIDPRVQFGRPCLAGSGIPTAVIVERLNTGESILEIAADYRREAHDVEEAIRFETRARTAA
ncbi:MAG: DUF433 domain-containing protein [Planctomycetota bacterium]